MSINFGVKEAKVVAILKDLPEIQELLVTIEAEAPGVKAYNYPQLNRVVAVGEMVLVNTTAVELALGTGGHHFVIPNKPHLRQERPGHIMKLRYTPWQFSVLAAEEATGPEREALDSFTDLQQVPVVTALLHSMLPGIIKGFYSVITRPVKIVYIMTDGAALPLALSNLVRSLQQERLLDATITTGNAFGGDYETVSLPSALVTARAVAKADLIIVGLGPGIAGTGTKYGFSGIELAWVLDLAASLGGTGLLVPRISEKDPRARHFGLSHHCVTLLKLAQHPALLPFSSHFSAAIQKEVGATIKAHNLQEGHQWLVTQEPLAARVFGDSNLEVKSMGRGLDEDPAFFQSAVATGYLAAQAYLGTLDELTPLEI